MVKRVWGLTTYPQSQLLLTFQSRPGFGQHGTEVGPNVVEHHALRPVIGMDAVSLHQIGLMEALAAAQKLNNAPQEIMIIGIEPKEIGWGLELTDLLKDKIAQIVNLVLEEF